MIKFDFSEVNDLIAALESAPAKVLPKIREALDDSAKKIEKDWENDWKGSSTVPYGPASISHSIKGSTSAFLGKSAMSAEIGPELRSQGQIVGILEYGTPNTGPRGFGAAAIDRHTPTFVENMSKATEGVL